MTTTSVEYVRASTPPDLELCGAGLFFATAATGFIRGECFRSLAIP